MNTYRKPRTQEQTHKRHPETHRNPQDSDT